MNDKVEFLKDKLNNLFFDKNLTCDICGKDVFNKENFCESCKAELPYNNEFICDKCGRKTLQSYAYCLECKSSAPNYLKARSAFCYDKDIKRLILKYKNGDKYLAKTFAKEMLSTLYKYFFRSDFMVYTPMFEDDEIKRGFNQAELIAKELQKLSGIAVKDEIIIKVKKTEMQKTLSKAKRIKNLEGAFKVINKAECKGKNILLIDDVLTTGATAEAICEKLLKAKAETVCVLTIASVPLNNIK